MKNTFKTLKTLSKSFQPLNKKSLYLFAAQKQQQSNNNVKQSSNKLDKASDYLLKQLKERKQRFASTRDNYRIDIGLVIERLPIFEQIDVKDLENLKFRRSIINKYKFKLEIPKDLKDFTEKHPTDEYDRHDTENLITHQNMETSESYHSNSKLFQYTDPEIQDPKSIQYASNFSVYLLVKSKENPEWHFPSKTIFERQSISEGLQELTDSVQSGIFSTYPQYNTPIACLKSEVIPSQQSDARNKVFKGVKGFYYQALHLSGNIERALIKSGNFEDYAWVPKRQLQNYLDQNSYETFVHVLTD